MNEEPREPEEPRQPEERREPDEPRHPAYGVLRQVTAAAAVLLADNPSAMTLEGTNTWVLRAPGASSWLVVDPGPADESHLSRLAALGVIDLVLITHGHPDHTAGVPRLVELTGAPVRALDPAFCVRAEPLRAGEQLTAAGLEITVLATPGHTADSVCFLLAEPTTALRPADGMPSAHATAGAAGTGSAVLTGDTVLGRGTTVIAHPDGRLGDYLDSLRSLAKLPPGTRLLPAHGPDLPDTAEIARHYLAHRQQRLDQVRAALAQLGEDADARAVVEVVYADVDPALWPAAEWSVQAQLAFLRAE